jgi:hypothetical protein
LIVCLKLDEVVAGEGIGVGDEAGEGKVLRRRKDMTWNIAWSECVSNSLGT